MEAKRMTPKPCNIREFLKIIWPEPRKRWRDVSSHELVILMMIAQNRERFRNVR
jgi:hypothetical protein